MRYKLATGLAALGLAFHLFMMFVYLGPPNLLQLRFGPLAQQYMRHFFYQNWHLFSPNPAISSSKFAVRCANGEGQWSEWKDPFAGLQERHQLTRITGYGKMLMMFGDIAQSLKEVALSEMKPCEDKGCIAKSAFNREIKQQAEALATRFSIAYCRQQHPDRPVQVSAIQYKILELFPLQFTESQSNSKKWDRVGEIPFAPIAMPQGGQS